MSLAASSLFNLQGAVAVVTGGGTGIGLMCAKALAQNGAKVYVVGRREEKLENASKHHTPEGQSGEIIPLQGDVTTTKDLDALVAQVSAKEKMINILVNNAGMSGPKVPVADSAQAFKDSVWKGESQEEWKNTFDLNTSAVYFTSVAFAPLLEKAVSSTHKACIVNISSISGITKKSQNHFCYNASKAACIHLTRMMASELSHLGIRINSIAPGVFPSEMTTDKNASNEKGEVDLDWDAKANNCPADRPGSEPDMAGTLLYLCSRAGHYTYGQILAVDGGLLLKWPSSA